MDGDDVYDNLKEMLTDSKLIPKDKLLHGHAIESKTELLANLLMISPDKIVLENISLM